MILTVSRCALAPSAESYRSFLSLSAICYAISANCYNCRVPGTFDSWKNCRIVPFFTDVAYCDVDLVLDLCGCCPVCPLKEGSQCKRQQFQSLDSPCGFGADCISEDGTGPHGKCTCPITSHKVISTNTKCDNQLAHCFFYLFRFVGVTVWCMTRCVASTMPSQWPERDTWSPCSWWETPPVWSGPKSSKSPRLHISLRYINHLIIH